MLALAALICFVVAVLLKLIGTALGSFDYIVFALIGLACLAAQGVPFGRFTNRA